ncbi:MFS transporter [Naumannella halotolerans]|uniref:Multidrug resistance protein n=1 Tax=Naumannella halotolerans TaxID=993414 RepID=A0A4R7J2A8_9ACTN|nr:MFS transporter [Naumannella halotolerans]TDT31322.1 multidrug resistance protein [Naumannella halotolerans]
MGVSRADVGLRSERGPVLVAMMVSTALIAVDATILATAVPSVVADLGDFERFPWLFSIYLLAQAVSVPIFSRLADTIGRKPVILTGIGFFLAGSILCGVAGDMTMLIIFRLVQGLGAGAVMPMTLTIVGDIYTVEERAKVQGYIASVWAVSSVIGPSVGGLLAQFANWRWIFFVNIPLCLLAGWIVLRRYQENVRATSLRIDLPGAITLTLGLSAVILAVLEGGNAWPWWSVPSVGIFAFGLVMLLIFGWVSRRSADPVVDLSLLARPLIITTTAVSAGVGGLMTGITSFVPTYLENSIGLAPILAGLAVAGMLLGWPLAATNAGRVYLRYGFRATVIIGSLIATAGAAVLVAVTPWPNPFTIGLGGFVVGFGLGWTAAPGLIAAQASVGWNERAAVTGMNMFARSAGSAVGVAVFGAIATNVINKGAGEHDFATIVGATWWVFVATVVVAVGMVVAALLMPRESVASPGQGEPAGE